MGYNLYVYEKKKERRTYINSKSSGENEGSKNSKVLEKFRNQKKGVPIN